MAEGSSVITKIPLRAEEADKKFIRYVLNTLLNSDDFIYQYPNVIAELINKHTDIIEVLAPKGVGKTLNIYMALHLLSEKHDIKSSGVYFDPATGKIDVIDASKFCEDEDFLKLPPKEQIRKSDLVVVDNWHYVADLVSEGYLSNTCLEMLAKATLDEIDDGKKVIIVTESPIKHYYQLGLGSNMFKKLVEKLDNSFRVEIKPPSLEVLMHVYDVKMDYTMQCLYIKYSDGTPRTFANLVNTFGKEITYDKFKEFTGINLQNLNAITQFLLENPVLPEYARIVFENFKITKDFLRGKISKYFIIKEIRKLEFELEILLHSDAVRAYNQAWNYKHKIRKLLRKRAKDAELRNKLFEELKQIEKTIDELKKTPEVSEFNKLRSKIRRLKWVLNVIDALMYLWRGHFKNLTDEELLDVLIELRRMYASKRVVKNDAINKIFMTFNCGSYYKDLLLKILKD